MMLSLRSFWERHGRSFSRTTLTAAAATVADYSTLVLLVEVFRVYYVRATACGALAGALLNFTLNRTWAFDHDNHAPLLTQALQYALVSGGSLFLNTGGVFLLTEFLNFRYLVSKIIVSLCVAFLWNYPLHKALVFRENIKGNLK